jgi:hypothetical protein
MRPARRSVTVKHHKSVTEALQAVHYSRDHDHPAAGSGRQASTQPALSVLEKHFRRAHLECDGLAAGEYGSRAVSSSADVSAASCCMLSSAASTPEVPAWTACAGCAHRAVALLMRRMLPVGG